MRPAEPCRPERPDASPASRASGNAAAGAPLDANNGDDVVLAADQKAAAASEESIAEWLTRAAQRLRSSMTAVDVAAGTHEQPDGVFRSEARAIAMGALGWSRVDLILRADTRPSPSQRARLDHWLEQRCDGFPFAYLAGECAFWSLDMAVTPACLVPRPDSEILVEQALLHLEVSAAARFLDLGTGTGAIAAAMGHSRPNAFGIAIDRDVRTLDCAQMNLRRWAPNVRLIAGHWLESLNPDARSKGKARFDVIVSNPPYLETDDPHLQNDSLRCEPRSALVSGGDGLDDIRAIVARAHAFLESSGWLLIEHGAQQGDRVRALFRKSGYARVETVLDWAGLDRVTKGCRSAHVRGGPAAIAGAP